MDRNHAVVVGGSMGGLLAARVLSDHFQRVTIIERDLLPAVAENRRGVPQGRHTHGLLASGRRVLDTLFPGLPAELIADGAVQGDICRDSRWFLEGGLLARGASELTGLLVSRPGLEMAVRKRVRALANVRIAEDSIVQHLLASEDRRCVTGVQLTQHNMMHEIRADLVVDASGRGSKMPDWLAELGYERPETESVHTALAYTTWFFRREPHHMDGDIAAIIPCTPRGKRGGVMLAQEGDRWTVTLISHFGPPAPSDLEGFLAFARSLPAPYIYDTIRTAEPLGEAVNFRFPASIRRRYEKLARFPEGLLVLGDAICSFNPAYGQGMSVAALEAMELNDCLSDREAKLAPRFFERAARVADVPWSIAAGNDLRMPEAVGKRGLGVRFINWYMAKFHRAAHSDDALTVAFLNVSNLIAPPPTLMTPRMALRVIRGNLFPRRPLAQARALPVRASRSA